MKIIVCFLLLSSVSFGQKKDPWETAAKEYRVTQTVPSLPSNEEISELVDKAAEKITQFQNILNGIKPILDKADPSFYKQDSAACDTALFTVKTLKKNGPSAYALVSLVSLLDDLSLDASRATLQIALLKMEGSASSEDFLAMASAGANCYDISELLLHATLRYVAYEEAALNEIVKSMK